MAAASIPNLTGTGTSVDCASMAAIMTRPKRADSVVWRPSRCFMVCGFHRRGPVTLAAQDSRIRRDGALGLCPLGKAHVRAREDLGRVESEYTRSLPEKFSINRYARGK